MSVELSEDKKRVLAFMILMGRPQAQAINYLHRLGTLIVKTDNGYSVRQDIAKMLTATYKPLQEVAKLQLKGFQVNVAWDGFNGGFRLTQKTKCDRIVWWDGTVTIVWELILTKKYLDYDANGRRVIDEYDNLITYDDDGWMHQDAALINDSVAPGHEYEFERVAA